MTCSEVNTFFMTATATLILNHRQIEQKTRRMAYQIYESNSGEEELILAGIMSSGFELAKRIKKQLSIISGIKVSLCQLKIDKKNPLAPIHCSQPRERYKNKGVVLVDDVLNSGATLIYGAKFFLEVPLKKLQTVVLVDRSHKQYPIKADFKGISLSTSLNETVSVTFEGENKVELF